MPKERPITTLAVGEEGPGGPVKDPPTRRKGEDGVVTSAQLGEEGEGGLDLAGERITLPFGQF
jgi:hypothetical protein